MNKTNFINSLYQNVDISLYLECPKYTEKLWHGYAVKKNIFATTDYIVKLEEPVGIFLQEISNCDDERYIEALKEYFINNTVKKLNPSENLKLSLISVMYQFNKNDFDNYKAFLDDIMAMKIDPYLNYYLGFEIVSLYESLETIFKNPYYKSLPELRELFRSSNKVFTREYKNTLFQKECNKLKEINSIVKEIDDEGLQEKTYELLINYAVNDENTLYSLINIKYLLVGNNRLKLFFSNLFKIESNQDIQKEFLNLIKDLKRNMFKELDIILGEDSFNKIFSIIFNSDSYRELYKNMGLLEAANHMYPFYKMNYLRKIKMIGDKSLKEVYRGKEVSYPEGTINMVVKPDRIIDRMKELYFRIDDSYNYEFLDDIHNKSKSVFSVFDKFNMYMNNPFNRIKQKVKNKK